MATNFISPGVYVIERDFSDYVAGLGSTSVGMVGTAKKGPLNVPTLITTAENFIDVFGEPSINQYGPHGAINYLRRGSALWYLRVAKTYTEETATMVTQPVANGDDYDIVVSTEHGITVGDYIRIREDGKRTSWALKVVAVSSDTLTIDGSTFSRWIDTYTSAAVVDVEASDSPTGDAANAAEVFAFQRYSSAVTDLVKFTARNSGAWANYGTSSGIEVQISDGGGFTNIDPITGRAYEAVDGTLLEGVVPGAPSVDSFEALLALTSADVVSKQTRGVNKDYFNTPILSTEPFSDYCLFGVADASYFSVGDSVIVHGSTSGSAARFDGNYFVADVNTATDALMLVDTTATTQYTIVSAASAATGTKFTLDTAPSTLLGNDYFLVEGTDVAAFDTILETADASTSGVTVTISVPWDNAYSAISGGTMRSGVAVAYVAGSNGYIINTTREAAAGVYLCSTITDEGPKWRKVGVHTKQVKVLYQGNVVEHFEGCVGYDITSPQYWDTVIGNADAPVSEYIYCEYLGSGAQPINTYHRVKHPNNPKLLMGNSTVVKLTDTTSSTTTTKKNSRGVDGSNPDESAYIGTISNAGVYTGLQNFRKVEAYDINLLCAPGQYSAAVVESILDICESRSDCLGLIDTPFGLTVQDAIDWHNGQGVYSGLHSAFASNKAAAYYPWVKQYDPYSRSDIWLPPTALLPGVFAYSDRNGELWFAPAGIIRASIPNARQVETVVSQGDMDAMYGPGNGNALNAIAQFPRDGIVVYGQRTLQRTPSSLDRVNVRRLLFYIEKAISTAVRRLVFEQNDPILWGQLTNLIEPFLQDLQGRRALEWFRVICDATTNPPILRNNNTVGIKVYIIPTKSAEKILLNIALLPSGANVEEFIAADLGE